MTDPGSPPGRGPDRDGVHLRLLWPQWQGAGTASVRELAPEFPFDVARRGYAVHPRQVISLQQLLTGFPSISGR